MTVLSRETDGTGLNLSTGYREHETDAYTIWIGWFKANVVNVDDFIVWAGQAGGNGFGDHHEIHFGVGASNTFRFLWCWGFSASIIEVSTSFSDTVGWHWYACRANWTDTANPVIDGWVDGVYMGSATSSSGPPSRANMNTGVYYGGTSGSGRGFNGHLSGLQIFNQDLAYQEMLQAVYSPGSVKKGLRALHLCGLSSPEPDLVSRKYDATIDGAPLGVSMPDIYVPSLSVSRFVNTSRFPFTGRFPRFGNRLMADAFALGKAPAAGGVTIPPLWHHYNTTRRA